MDNDGRVVSINIARARPNPYKPDTLGTGIDKRPVAGPVEVRAPGSRSDGLGSGLVGDTIGDRAHHGGDEQAVYAYAREDLDHFADVLGRAVSGGSFGENLTTVGLDVTGARIGERWLLGDEVVLEVTDPRIPCATFRGFIDVPGWLKTFTAAARPGAYLRVITPGHISAGDPIAVILRPDHDVTIGRMFRGLMTEPDLRASNAAALAGAGRAVRRD